jgi:hypothetical protein
MEFFYTHITQQSKENVNRVLDTGRLNLFVLSNSTLQIIRSVDNE